MSVLDMVLPLPGMAGRSEFQVGAARLVLYSTMWFEPESVLNWIVTLFPILVIFETLMAAIEPQGLLYVPLLTTVPMTVPQPVTVALGEITRPSAKV